ncbi:nuclear valosin-containing protein-like isoform X2 [Drosophila obscura]|uniref:nuclear valosin-containing protein-like isoform X2 n=1 Tax=Drosophila obscura TaxID=7282 RepID=UPI001BB2354B|nr:nuclear valosin-containing protein-like isoform X2 [Drosophila obscura]
MKKSKPLLHDHQITIRVKKYLEEHINETYLDVKLMTKELMNKYPEYSRRKFGPFRQLVHQAFTIISDSYNLDKVSSSEEDCPSEDSEPPLNSVMNNMMNSLYSQPRKPLAAKQITEPIDISSGDEIDDDSPSTTANGDASQAPPPPVISSNSLKRLMGDMPETNLVAPKKVKPNININQGPGQDSTQKFQSGTGKNHHSDGSCSRKDQRNSSLLYQQLRQQNQSPSDRNSGRSRKNRKDLELQHITESFRDIGGMDGTLKELCEMLIHIKSPEFYFQLGLLPSRGLLLHGPPGCGKTYLARAISGQLKMPLLEVPATELIGGISGESEERIRDVFEQAMDSSPCVLFIDEIDAIGGNRQWAAKDMERRIVSQLISSLDNLKATEFGQSVVVIAATTRPDVLDPGLRRIGRFDHEIPIHIPSRKERREIMRIQCEGLSVDPKLNYDKIAELTPGYVGADLMALVCRAAAIAVKRRSMKKFRELHAASEMNMTTVTLDDDEPNDESVAGAKADAKAEEAKDDAAKAEVEKADGDKEEKDNTDGDMEEKDKPDEAKEKADAPDSDSVEKGAEGTTNGQTPDKPSDAAMEVDEETPVTEVTQEKEQEIPANDYYEPTLAELTNFLDNPPEEFSDPNFCLTLLDFTDAIKVMQPSAKREGFITVPDTTWEDIGALQDIRDELKLAVLAPVKYPEKLERLGLTAPSGVLLCGPPGCGKTLLAKAIANEAGINFISVKGPELMNMYVGESERAVRACFQRARNSAPCVIFFDEFDSLCPKRSEGGDGNNSGTRIVNQLLTEMDGVEERKGVYILAATNRPDIIDPAILRPGRLDTILYVGLPEQNERAEILKATTKNGTRPVMADDVDLDEVAAQTEGYTGADLAGLVKQASMYALRQSLAEDDTNLDGLCVRRQHFRDALLQLRPSVSEQDRKVYDKLRQKYAAPRVPTFDAK